jgi:hypothetical protein
MANEAGIDLDQEFEFYDPHSGKPFHGAVAGLPTAIKRVIDQLNGQRMTLREAVARIKAVRIGHVHIAATYGFISLQSHSDEEMNDPNRSFCVHSWRLIRFR